MTTVAPKEQTHAGAALRQRLAKFRQERKAYEEPDSATAIQSGPRPSATDDDGVPRLDTSGLGNDRDMGMFCIFGKADMVVLLVAFILLSLFLKAEFNVNLPGELWDRFGPNYDAGGYDGKSIFGNDGDL